MHAASYLQAGIPVASDIVAEMEALDGSVRRVRCTAMCTVADGDPIRVQSRRRTPIETRIVPSADRTPTGRDTTDHGELARA
jgi:hypothetical protein